MKPYLSWLIFLAATIALFLVFWAEDRGYLPFSAGEIALALCAIAIVLKVIRRRSPAALEQSGAFSLIYRMGRTPLILGIAMLISSVAWLLVSLLLASDEYLIVIPFFILFFGGAAILGTWITFKILSTSR